MKSTTKSIKQAINQHILGYFDPADFSTTTALEALKKQLAVFNHMPTDYAKGVYMAEGGTFLIYYDEQREFLNSLGINPANKQFSDHKVFEQYCHLIGRQIAELVR